MFGPLSLSPIDLLGLAQLLLLGFLFVYALGVASIAWSLTHPPRRRAGWAVARGLASDPGELDHARYGLTPRPFRNAPITHAGATYPTWEIDGDAPTGPTAILTHGWNDGKVNALARLEPFIKHCSMVIAWDTPGHGDAPGHSNLGRTEATLLDALIARTTGPVVLMGWSMGAGISLASAARSDRVIGLVCEAPYSLPQTPASKVLAARGMPGLGMLQVALTVLGGRNWQRPAGPFDRTLLAQRLAHRVPVLVLHGSDDPVCPADDALAIAHASGGQIIEIPNARHNDLWTTPTSRPLAVLGVDAFLARVAAGGLVHRSHADLERRDDLVPTSRQQADAQDQ